MIKSLIFLLVLGAVLGGSYFFQYSPCETPIEYSIGKIDSGYDVTQEELIEDSKIATGIWSSTQNKQLFEYNPKATFTINMIYDSRQELTSKISKLDSDLKKKQDAMNPKIEEFKQQQLTFEKKIQDLNNEIQYWNNKGGAPKEEYDKLVSSQSRLREEGRALNQTALALGQQTSDYNVDAKNLNQTINNYQEVLEFKPEEGLYEMDGNKRKISIYIDVDKNDFLHTLTHEFGHSLGLDHVDNPESIMYPQTTNVLEPSVEEITQLTEICKKRSLYEIGTERLRTIIVIIQERMKDGSRVKN